MASVGGFTPLNPRGGIFTKMNSDQSALQALDRRLHPDGLRQLQTPLVGKRARHVRQMDRGLSAPRAHPRTSGSAHSSASVQPPPSGARAGLSIAKGLASLAGDLLIQKRMGQIFGDKCPLLCRIAPPVAQRTGCQPGRHHRQIGGGDRPHGQIRRHGL